MTLPSCHAVRVIRPFILHLLGLPPPARESCPTSRRPTSSAYTGSMVRSRPCRTKKVLDAGHRRSCPIF
ncbi:MAG: hypothetical protein ACKODC_05150, partial [Limnohabitans sp.]